MRNLLWTIVLFLCAASQARADTDPDSLRRVWNDRARPDTVRLKAGIQLIWDHVMLTDPDSALVLAKLLYKEADSCSVGRSKAAALRIQGCVRYMLGDPGQALELLQRAMGIWRSLGDSAGVAMAMYNMAMVHKDQGDLAQAMDCALVSLRNEEAGGRKRQVALTYNLIGVIYMTLEDNANALDSYKKSQDLCEQLGDSGQVAVALMNIASLENLGDKNELALSHIERALAIVERNGNLRERAAAYRSFGQILESLGRTDEAMERYEQSMRYQEELGDIRGQARTLVNISGLLNLKGLLGPAKEKGLQALTLARKAEDIRGVNEAAAGLYQVYKAMHQPTEALAMHELMTRMQDSLQSDENQRGIMRQRYAYEYEKREALANAEFERQQVAALLALERTRSQRLFLGAGVVFIAILALLLVNRYRLKRRLQVAQLRARLSRDLHDDIGSTLSSISILSNVARKRVEATGDADAAASLAKISDRSQRLMRNMSDIVWSVDPDKDSLEELLARMREFGAAVLEPKGISFSFEGDREAGLTLPPMVKSNLYLIFKEAVNNAAKHAQASDVVVSFEFVGDRLRMRIADDGIGMHAMTGPLHTNGGNGMRNMRIRAAEMRADLQVLSDPDKGTRITLELPFR